MDEVNIPLQSVRDLYWLLEQCEQRCLYEFTKWTNEALSHVPEHVLEEYEESDYLHVDAGGPKMTLSRRNTLNFAKSLIGNKEYRRAKFYLEGVQRTTPVEHFLYYFSWYLISVRNRHENEAEDEERNAEYVDTVLAELRRNLEYFKRESPESFDCFLEYLLALVRRDSCSKEQARKTLEDIVLQQDSRCWPAWDLLSTFPTSREYCEALDEQLPTRWHCKLFIGECLSRLEEGERAVAAYESALQMLGNSPFVECKLAIARQKAKNIDGAIELFEGVRAKDPYRLEQMDVYSDILFVKDMSIQLAKLAKEFFESHRFRWETCYIVANYYSNRANHDLAQEFLKRAARLNPHESSVWVLLGHEYLESKNQAASISAYRKATVVNPNDYRGWYGLGQLYEIVQLPAYALYHYQKAVEAKHTDSRSLIALGLTYQNLNQYSDAEKCYKKAYDVGDVEGGALIKLGKLYEKQRNLQMATEVYEAYLENYTEDTCGLPDAYGEACVFLAKQYLAADLLDRADSLAEAGLSIFKTKEDAGVVMRQIALRRMELREHGTEDVEQEMADVAPVPSETSFTGGLATSEGRVCHSTPSAGATRSPAVVPRAPDLHSFRTPENTRPTASVPLSTPRRPGHPLNLTGVTDDMAVSDDDDIDVSF